MSSAVEIIAAKRDGHAVDGTEIAWFIRSYLEGAIADEQMAAFLMAVQLRGLTNEETRALTQAYVDSGVKLTYPSITRPTTDKHSTGGVGDKITLILTPMVMALGAAVPQLSGRGLGHTGGTLDKLESISGFRSTLDTDSMQRQLEDVGGFVCAASDDLAPADRRIYALRDVTATVPSIPLIAASIMSKKIAEGTDALVLDVKVGRGAFMSTLEQARELARTMVEIGNSSHVATRAVLSAMDHPLGNTAGNALEVKEALEVLSGAGPADVRELSVLLATEMLQAAGLPVKDVEAVLRDGRARAAFDALVRAQGGDPLAPLPSASTIHLIRATDSGFVADLDAMKIAMAAWHLGAGRARKEDAVDHAAGVVWHRRVGESVQAGDVVFELHTSDPSKLPAGIAAIDGAMAIGPSRPADSPLVLEIIR